MSEVAIDVRVRWSGAGAVLLRILADDEDPSQDVVEESLDVADGTEERCPTPSGPLVRVAMPEGERTLRYTARVRVAPVPRTAGPVPTLAGIDLALAAWTAPSRYCPADRLAPTALALTAGRARADVVRVVHDWVAESIDYRPGATDPLASATDTLLARQGVCRDFAHLTVALLRANGVPARVVAVYAPSVDPPDFHAVAEAHDGDGWILLDPTGMSAPETTVRIATGLDAAQTAWATTVGAVVLDPPDVRVVASPPPDLARSSGATR